MITATMVLQNAMANGNGIGQAVPSLAMSLSMLAGSLMFPMLNRRYEEKRIQSEETQQSEKYHAYLDGMRAKITKTLEEQRANLLENYASSEECAEWIMAKYPGLFNRTLQDSDFLSIRLGLGERALDGAIRFPQMNEFRPSESSLDVLLRQLEDEPHVMQQAPMTLSLMEHRVLGMVGDREQLKKYTCELLMQICAQHSPDELKLVLLLPEEEEEEWEYAKWLPHVWNNLFDFRLIATEAISARSLSAYLETMLAQRDGQSLNPAEDVHYLVLSADARLMSRTPVLSKVLSLRRHWGDQGIGEGRRPNAAHDPVYYLTLFGPTELGEDIETQYANAPSHAWNTGIKEDRNLSATFNMLDYMILNPDVTEALQHNIYLCLMHYITTGYYESRNTIINR